MIERRVDEVFCLVVYVLALDVAVAAASLLGQAAAVAGALALVAILTAAWRRASARLMATRTAASGAVSGARPVRGAAIEPSTAFRRALAALCLVSYGANLYVLGSPRLTAAVATAIALGIALFAAAIVWPPPARRLAGAAVVIGVAVRLAALPALPIDPARADMLPVVLGAARHLLDGQDPYTLYHMPSWVVPLAYFPGTWLAYLPAAAARLDARLINLACELGVGAGIVGLGGDRRALLVWAWTFVSASTVQWSLLSEHAVFWLVLFATLASVARGRTVSAALLLGVAVATSPLASLVALFIGLAWLRALPPRALVAHVALALAVAAALLGPFVLWNPASFFYGAFRWHNDSALYGLVKWQADRSWASQVGLAGLFWRSGTLAWAKLGQVLVVAGLAVVYLRRGAPLALFGPTLALALGAFMALNPINWGYLYWPPAVALLAHVAARPGGIGRPRRRSAGRGV